MREGQFVIHCESDGFGESWHAFAVEGLPASCLTRANSGESEVFLLMIEEEEWGSLSLREEEFYSISKIIDGKEESFAVFFCKEIISRVGGRCYLYAAIEYSDVLIISILDAWEKGIRINWRNLSGSYGPAWLSNCAKRGGENGWIQNYVSENVLISSAGLRSHEDFYCYLGESFFGYKGYAGRDLDGLREVLLANKNEKLVVSLIDAPRVFDFLLKISGREDYFRLFESALMDAGIRLIP